jgi:carbon-monoxide dehydrogenase large subunit
MLHLAAVRSPHAHARIRRIDASQARAFPGVCEVLTPQDVAGRLKPFELVHSIPDQKAHTYDVLPQKKVHYVGQVVAAVVAEDRYRAEDAAEAVQVEYEALPPVLEVEDALRPGSPALHDGWGDNRMLELQVGTADAEESFAGADLVLEETFRIGRQAAVPLEGRAIVATYDPPTERLTVWYSTQAPNPFRTMLAAMLGLEEHQIRILTKDVGGGFGVKLHYYPEEVLACYLALRGRRPVKFVEDRREHFLSTVHARQQTIKLTAGFRRDGSICGLRSHVLSDQGAHLHTKGASPSFLTARIFTGPYRVQAHRSTVTGVATSKVPSGAYRGFGQPQAVFAMERTIEVAARRLGLDANAIRQKNFIPPEAFPYRTASNFLYDSGNYPEALRRVLKSEVYERLTAERDRRREEGRFAGVGLAIYVELTGMGPSKILSSVGINQGGYETGALRIDPSGRITAATGIINNGQGHETILAQVCADVLGVTPDDVTVIQGDTDICPYSMYGTASSRGAPMGGGSMFLAAGAMREKLVAIAAHTLECSPEDIVLEGGAAFVRGAPGRRLTLKDLAGIAYQGGRLPEGMEPGLEVKRSFDPPTWSFSYGVHLAGVDVDIDTGHIEILQYHMVHDCGTVINPLIVDGQLVGGLAQGLGGSTMEELVYGEDGQLLTTTLMDYLIPTAAEMPPVSIEHMETRSPYTPGGMKGMAEGSLCAAPACVGNAVADALSRLGDADIAEYPFTPEQVWRVVRRLRESHDPGR